MESTWAAMFLIIFLLCLKESEQIGVSGFQPIPGPRSKGDRIAIIGAGASGTFMASLLKKQGFQKVVIFEKADRVGGKTLTTRSRSDVQEMGAWFSTPDDAVLYRLLEEYNAGRTTPVPVQSVRNGISQRTVGAEVLAEAAILRPDLITIEERQAFVQDALKRYTDLHRILFGYYDGFLMPRPNMIVLQQTNMTFQAFLRAHNLQILETAFLYTTTTQGYGQLDEISALYGLIWNTPRLINEFFNEPDNRIPTDRIIRLIENGYQSLWKRMIQRDRLDVRLNHKVIQIKRFPNRKIQITYSVKGQVFQLMFDFLILTPELKSLLRIVDFTQRERNLFSRTNNEFFTTSLVHHQPSSTRGFAPISFFGQNILSRIHAVVATQRDCFAARNYIVDEAYKSQRFPGGSDGLRVQTTIFSQFSRRMPSEESLNTMLNIHLDKVLNTSFSFLELRRIFPIFPRYNVKDMADGILWDIYDMQGKYNTWYLGSSVTLDSIGAVLEYVLLIVRGYLSAAQI